MCKGTWEDRDYQGRRGPVGKETTPPMRAGEGPFLCCFHWPFSVAGRPLLLRSCPVSAAVARTFLLLSA